MSFTSKLIFQGITRTAFRRLLERAKLSGLVVIRNTGEAARGGIKILWRYDAEQQVLETECVRSPFWISTALVQKRLSQEIESTLGSCKAA